MTTAQTDSPTIIQEGLAAQLLARRRRRLPRLTLGLLAAVLAGAVFVGGVEVQKHYGKASASSNAANGFPAAFAARAAGAGGAGAGAAALFGGGGGATNGTVTLIKGRTLYVTDVSGNTVLVHTTATSRVSKSVTANIRTIHPGDTVTVSGSQNKDGSVAARLVTIGGGANG
jgi:hypothetical protein